MKKIVLSLLTVFMVLSLSVVLVKASEITTVSLEDGVQIRTDGNNGLRWEAKVTNAAEEGQVYGFLFAQGELTAEQLNKDTEGVIAKEVDELKEDGTYHATMVKFPTSAAVQDISVRAYVRTGETYIYSGNVVVRNLAEVAVEAYEKGTAAGDFVKAVYDASKTTFNVNGGQFVYPYKFTISRYDSSCWNDTNYQVGMNSAGKSSSSGASWYRLFLTETSEGSGVYQITASGVNVTPSDYTYDYMIGSFADSKYDVESVKTVVEMAKDANITNYYIKFLDEIPEASNVCSIRAIAHTDPEILVGESSHIGGGEILPTGSKDYYDFVGWCGKSDLSDTPTLKQGKDRTLYAKYTPTNYEITYELNGGTSSKTLVNSYNIETATFALPTASEMSIVDGNFGGWYDNETFSGNPITEIALGSHGNKTLYAKWIMNAPTEVELSDADKAVFAQVTPTIIVDSSFNAGKYSIKGQIYEAGVTAVSSIATALSVAKENDIIYVFDGTYAETLTITTSNLTIIGPNYNIHGNTTRSSEAVLDGVLTIGAGNVTINGLKHNKAIKVGANNVTITNCYVSPTATVACNGNNRQGCIVDSANISDLTVSNCYINAPGSSNSYANQYMSFTNVSNLTIQGNFITNSNCKTSSASYNGMRIYTSGGFIRVIENEFRWGEGGSLMNLGTNTNNCTEISIIDNYIDNNGLISTAGGIFVNEAKATLTVLIMGNTFKNCATRVLRLSYNYGPTVNVMYNNFAEGTKYETFEQKTAIVNFTNNYYAEAQTTSTSDYGIITSDAERVEKYLLYLNGGVLPEKKVQFIAYLDENVKVSTTSLPFHNGGYFSNLTSLCYYNQTNAAASTWQYAYKVGYSYDESLDAYVIKQLLASGTVLDDSNRTSEHYLIIHTTDCPTGLAWGQGLSVGQVLVFSSDPKDATTTNSESTTTSVSVYTDSYKKVTEVSAEDSIELPTPTATGYSFGGWYDNPEFTGSPVTSYTAETEGEKVYFYAKWEKAYYGVAVKSSNSAAPSAETLSVSADGLTVTFDGTETYISFQIYNGGEKMVMSPSKWSYTTSDSNVIAFYSNYSCIAKVVGAGTSTLTFTNVTDSSIVVSITLTVVVSSAE